MNLTDLEPQFLARSDDYHYRHVDKIGEADGLWLLCPVCWLANAGAREGVHGIICWEPHVPQSTSPQPGRWVMQGTGYGDLTLVAGSSSVLLTSGCRAHFFVERGEIRLC